MVRRLPQLTRLSFSPFFIHLIIALLLISAYLLRVSSTRLDNHLLDSDGRYYYSYLRSVVLDHDFDIENDVSLYNLRLSDDNPRRLGVSYAFAIGPALLWSPFFATGHLVALAANRSDFPVATDGFSYIEEGFVGCGSIVYVVLGLYLLFKLLSRRFPARLALISSLTIFLSSSLLYYTAFEPTMSHAVEFFSVVLFLWCLGKSEAMQPGDWLRLGAAAGLMCIVRWQNAVLLVLILTVANRGGSERGRMSGRNSLTCLAAFAIGAAPFLALQSIFWQSVFGRFLLVPQGDSFLTPFQPHILEVLFSTRHGLFSWTPVAMFGFVGLFFLGQRGTIVAYFSVSVLALYICSIAQDWWGGDSFGMRRMIGVLPILTFGLAALLQYIGQSKARWIPSFLVPSLIVWNLLFVVQFRLGYVSPNDYLTVKEMTVDKFTFPLQLLQKSAK